MLEGAHVFNVHGETIAVSAIIAAIEDRLPSARGLITSGGPPIPMPPALEDGALRAAVPGLPRTSVAQGVADTIGRFAALRDAGRLDLTDIEDVTPVPRV
jgi:hypothetical protein